MSVGDSDPPGEDDSGPRLESVGDVQREMARVYRAMRGKRLAISDGNGLTQTLQYLAKVTEIASELEALEKLDRLERKRAEPAQINNSAH